MYRNADVEYTSDILREADRRRWIDKWVIRGTVVGICATFASAIVWVSRPGPPPPCQEMAKVIILHDTGAFTCYPNSVLSHEKMDDYKVYVECKCK